MDRGSAINPVKDDINEEKEEINVTKLKIVSDTSGGEPPHWLSTLEVGTVFLAQQKSNLQNPGTDFTLLHFKLIGKTEKAYILGSSYANQPAFVDPLRFCKQFNLYEELAIIPTEEVDLEEKPKEEVSKILTVVSKEESKKE